MTTSNTLVAYFSATGTTKKIAETLALVAQADLFEIVPKKLYTKEDLDWHNLNSRSSVECNDTTARPEIATRVPNMDNYQNIFIGFPIWWYAAPRIIETFLESYNMENKFIIPFCTSGSSSISQSVSVIREAEPEAQIKKGLQISSAGADDSSYEVRKWLEEIK